MTLSNEQRAHDLAIASLPRLEQIVDAQNHNNGNKDIKFDIYIEYKKAYDACLAAINKDF